MARLLSSSEVETVRRQLVKQIVAYRKALERKLKELEDGTAESVSRDE